MQARIIDLNCRDKEYKFNLSVISEQEWRNLAHNIVLYKGQNIKILELNGYKIVIRDNKAKIKLFYQDTAYHELEYHFDEFGRPSKLYQDDVSEFMQEIMLCHYGAEYQKALESLKNSKLNTEI